MKFDIRNKKLWIIIVYSIILLFTTVGVIKYTTSVYVNHAAPVVIQKKRYPEIIVLKPGEVWPVRKMADNRLGLLNKNNAFELISGDALVISAGNVERVLNADSEQQKDGLAWIKALNAICNKQNITTIVILKDFNLYTKADWGMYAYGIKAKLYVAYTEKQKSDVDVILIKDGKIVQRTQITDEDIKNINTSMFFDTI